MATLTEKLINSFTEIEQCFLLKRATISGLSRDTGLCHATVRKVVTGSGSAKIRDIISVSQALDKIG